MERGARSADSEGRSSLLPPRTIVWVRCGGGAEGDAMRGAVRVGCVSLSLRELVSLAGERTGESERARSAGDVPARLELAPRKASTISRQLANRSDGFFAKARATTSRSSGGSGFN